MRIPMPAAVLIGGASRRMGRPKAALAYGAGTLAEFQAARLSDIFEDVFFVAKEQPAFAVGPSRVVLDGVSGHAAMHGLVRALEEAPDRVFVLAVDLPAIPDELVRLIAGRGLESRAAAVLPRSAGRLQPLAGVWRRAALEPARRRVVRGELALAGLAEEVGAEVLDEDGWRAIDPAGIAFTNLNTLEDYAALRERA
jgi:molybdopterin-guanine dinucleotide biosynthesis protein A